MYFSEILSEEDRANNLLSWKYSLSSRWICNLFYTWKVKFSWGIKINFMRIILSEWNYIPISEIYLSREKFSKGEKKGLRTFDFSLRITTPKTVTSFFKNTVKKGFFQVSRKTVSKILKIYPNLANSFFLQWV